MPKIRVMLVDDHQLVRAGIRRILEEHGDIEVVAEASDGESALQLARQVAADVVLMDISMPGGMGGIEATRRILRVLPEVKVIALTVMDDEPFPARLHEAGAVGYLTKGCPASEMLDAVRAVMQGLPYIDSRMARKHMEASWQHGEQNPFGDLSAREMQVAMMTLDGRAAQAIADALCVSPKTVSTYRQRIFDKLGVKNDVELTRLAYRFGFIQDGIADQP
jgi:two-component system invasion response regulator UvrY